MKTNENQKSTREYKVYIHRLKTWVEVTEEQYYAYYRDIWATRKRAQAHGQCMCPKSKTWMCDGDCLACEFRAAGDNLSLDYTVEDGEGNQKSWADDLRDDTPDAQSIMEDRELLCALYQKLQELDPEGRRICELIMEGKSERDIASIMGYNNQSAVNYRKQKAYVCRHRRRNRPRGLPGCRDTSLLSARGTRQPAFCQVVSVRRAPCTGGW